MSLSPPSQDWMVLQCNACSTRMKVRREQALSSRLLCPGCRTPVPVQEEGVVAAEEFRPAALPARPAPGDPAAARPSIPLRESGAIQGKSYTAADRPSAAVPAERLQPQVEFDGRFRDEDVAGASGPERRVRIKKRKTKRPVMRYVELTDWDRRDLSALPEAEVAADIWDEVKPIPEDVAPEDEEHEYVVEAVEGEDGQTRTTKKRVRRRRLLLGARLFFQRFTSMSRWVTKALAVLVAGVAVYGIYVLQQKYTAPDLPPVTDPPVDRAILTQYDTLGAEKAVRDFLAADGIEAKLKYVRQPERIRSLMEQWYRGERTAGPLTAGEIQNHDKKEAGGENGGKDYYVILAMPVNVPDPLYPGATYEEMTFFAVQEIREGPTSRYLVDWETSTGYQDIPLETYKSTMPPEPYPFRVFMKADDYYNHGFSETDWQCVTLYYPGRDFHLYGYINRNSQEGRKLLPLVQNSRRSGVIAELIYPADPASRDQVIVQRLIHDSWYYSTAREALRFGEAIPVEKAN